MVGTGKGHSRKRVSSLVILLSAVPELTGPEFGSVGFGVRTDVASASGSLRRLVFRVQVLVAVKGLMRGATASRTEGQEGYECRVEIYFTAMLFDN